MCPSLFVRSVDAILDLRLITTTLKVFDGGFNGRIHSIRLRCFTFYQLCLVFCTGLVSVSGRRACGYESR